MDFSYTRLPNELWLRIISYLDDDFKDYARLSLVCKQLNLLVSDHLNRIKKLDIEENWIAGFGSEKDMKTLEPLFMKLTNLREATLSHSVTKFEEGAHCILTDNCPLLTTLELQGIEFAPSELFKLVTRCANLTTLRIDSVKLDSKDELSLLLPAVKSRLLHLDMPYVERQIFDSSITDEEYSLQSLDIRYFSSRSDALRFVCSCPKLELLYVDLDRYDRESLDRILAKCPNLKNLTLENYCGEIPDIEVPRIYQADSRDSEAEDHWNDEIFHDEYDDDNLSDFMDDEFDDGFENEFFH